MLHNQYNGWTNYETWLFNMWFDDAFTEEAQEHYNDAEDDETFTKEENAALSLADYIESYAEEFIGESIPKQAGFVADLINASLSEINYHEIAKHYLADVDKDENEEEAT